MTIEEMVEQEMRKLYERIDATDIKRRDVVVNINVTVGYDGNMTVGYGIRKGYGDDGTRGSSLEATFVEFLRRQGWDERNKPMALIGSSKTVEHEPVKADDDVPI